MYSYSTHGTAITKMEPEMSKGANTILSTHLNMGAENHRQKNGELFTRGAGTYRILGFSDIQQVLNTGLLKGVNWAKLRNIQSYKVIGGLALFLAPPVKLHYARHLRLLGSFAVDSKAMGIV
ncbi:hypothetical protein HOY82DRAFT_606879 [Tuber indicum]|nr:hypothetical protein HOY82DRAFT_606879 [Tuber indicum]